MRTIRIGNDEYMIAMQPPPGQIVAPNGFPTDPRPRAAPKEFLDAMDVRLKVFCDEQHCSRENEIDEDDPKSWSWILYQADRKTGQHMPVSTIRIVPPPHPAHPNGFHDPTEQPYIKPTRVATVIEARGKGLSKVLLDEAFKYLCSHSQEVGEEWKGLALIHAQVYVERMYSKLGFVTDERLGRWDEEGIQHLGMWKKLDITN